MMKLVHKKTQRRLPNMDVSQISFGDVEEVAVRRAARTGR